MVNTIEYHQFLDVDIRAGTVIKAKVNTSLKNPSIVLLIDFGSEIGIKKSKSFYFHRVVLTYIMESEIC